jgi:hypothetical protein
MKIKQVLSVGWYQWEGGGHKERAKEGKYGRSTMCENGTVRPVETIPRRG